MRTILIAEENLRATSERVNLLSAAGYNVITCPGPWPPERCIRCDVGYCPLTEGADLMIYDPKLTARDHTGQIYNLAIASGIAHPEVPLVLAADDMTRDDDSVQAVKAALPRAEVAAAQPPAFLAQVARLLATPSAE